MVAEEAKILQINTHCSMGRNSELKDAVVLTGDVVESEQDQKEQLYFRKGKLRKNKD
jgi:hypothetical protein